MSAPTIDIQLAEVIADTPVLDVFGLTELVPQFDRRKFANPRPAAWSDAVPGPGENLMSVRSVARCAAVIFAAAVLTTLVWAAQRAAWSEPAEDSEARAQDLLPSTKADAGVGARERVRTQEVLSPSTKAAPPELRDQAGVR